MKQFIKLIYNFQTIDKYFKGKVRWYQHIVWQTARAIRNMTVIASFVIVGWISAVTYNKLNPLVRVEAQTIEVPAKQPFPAILQRICNAEVTGNPNKTSHQFNADGSVVRGRTTPSDVGYCQINEGINNDLARKLGYDIFTEEGNKDFALYLFNHRGTEPWNASKFMWKI